MLEPTLKSVAAAVDPAKAASAIVAAVAIAGSLEDWNGYTAAQMLDQLRRALPADIPPPNEDGGDQEHDFEFWSAVAADAGISPDG